MDRKEAGLYSSAGTFFSDFTSHPVTAYTGGPSSAACYDPGLPNLPLRRIVIQGYWNKGAVLPYSDEVIEYVHLSAIFPLDHKLRAHASGNGYIEY